MSWAQGSSGDRVGKGGIAAGVVAHAYHPGTRSRGRINKFETDLGFIMKPCHGTKKKPCMTVIPCMALSYQHLRSEGSNIQRSRSPLALSEFEATMGYIRPTTFKKKIHCIWEIRQKPEGIGWVCGLAV